MERAERLGAAVGMTETSLFEGTPFASLGMGRASLLIGMSVPSFFARLIILNSWVNDVGGKSSDAM
jgi:hypothetical protein